MYKHYHDGYKHGKSDNKRLPFLIKINKATKNRRTVYVMGLSDVNLALVRKANISSPLNIYDAKC